MLPKLSFVDKCIQQFDQTLKVFIQPSRITTRPYPAENKPEPLLSPAERSLAASLMRINHTGEVCAQALYQGQALTARNPRLRKTMQTAAEEEIDHLDWCQQRLEELNSRTSYLNPLWYIGSLTLGIAAGIAGDRWSLGFLAETERQVTLHLLNHLEQLPQHDEISRSIVEQMKIDEQKHAETAIAEGAAELPLAIKIMMRCMSKVMTTVVYNL